MSAFYPLQATFNNGELTEALGRRDDIDFWRKSLKRCRNFEVMPHGGIRRRSGTRFVRETADSAEATRLMPFVFSADQAYVLAMCENGSVRFHANRGTVMSGPSPYSVAHGYGDAFALSWEQVNDTLWLAGGGLAPKDLKRLGETNWTLTDHEFKNGPWLDVNTTSTTLTPAETGCITPLMTSNTAPSGVISNNGGSLTIYRVFNRVVKGEELLAAAESGWFQVQLASAKVADAYWMTAPASANRYGNTFAQWAFQGSNDGVTWDTLDRRDSQSGWVASETRYYEFANEKAYLYYRVDWSGGGGVSGGTNTSLAEIAIHQKAEDQTPFNLTASATTGINGGAGFHASDVGRVVRLWGADSRWRWARITEVISPTVVKIRLYGHALINTSPIQKWQLGAIAEQAGWPTEVGLYNERLYYGGTDTKPVTAYGSKQGVFDDFGISDPLVETDAVTVTMLSSAMNRIEWFAADIDLVCGSAGQIRSIGPSDVSAGFSALNVTQRKGPTTGAENLRPLVVGGTILYIGRGGTKIRELIIGDQARYVAPELTILGEHVFLAGVVDWCFRETPEPAIYAALGDGKLACVAYDREQKIVGVAVHDVGGAVESAAAIPAQAPGHDDVYMVVRRTIGGVTKRYVEVLERPFDWNGDAVEDGFFVDCGVTYSGAAATTITGLGHLEGQAVSILADGAPVKGKTVSGGQVTLDAAATKVHVGLAYTSQAVTHPVSGPQADGSLFGRRVAVTGFMLDVLASGSAKAGAWVDTANWTPAMTEALLRRGDELFGSKIELVTGTIHAEIEGSWAEGGGQVVIETDEPLPLIVRAVIPQVEGEP